MKRQAYKNCEIHHIGGTNELANQIGLSLPARLLRQYFPSILLSDQHRLKSTLTVVPSSRIYGSALHDAPVTFNEYVKLFQRLVSRWLSLPEHQRICLRSSSRYHLAKENVSKSATLQTPKGTTATLMLSMISSFRTMGTGRSMQGRSRSSRSTLTRSIFTRASGRRIGDRNETRRVPQGLGSGFHASTSR